MRRLCIAALLVLSAAVTGCGEPLVVLGDLPGFMRVVVGLPNSAGETIDTLATKARLFSPSSVVALENGDILVLDQGRRILRVTPANRLTLLFNGPDCFDQTCLTGPQGAALRNNVLLIADNLANHIWRFDLQTNTLASFAGTGAHGTAPDGSVAAQSPISSPGDVDYLPDGRVVFTEREGNRIRVVSADGRLQTIAGTGTAGYTGDGGSALAAQLNSPTGLAVGGNTLYIGDTGNNVIRAIDLTNNAIRTIAGTGLGGFSGDGGPALAAKLSGPWALTLATDGQSLYFTDVGNNRVRVVNLTNGVISSFAGTGATAFTGNGRSAGETALSGPNGLAFGSQGFLYIADTGHQIVWRTPVRF